MLSVGRWRWATTVCADGGLVRERSGYFVEAIELSVLVVNLWSMVDGQRRCACQEASVVGQGDSQQQYYL